MVREVSIMDLHVHTVYSRDSVIPPQLVASYARVVASLDGIAITDHNTLEGWRRAARSMKEGEFLLIPGVELEFPEGELLLYGIEELPKRFSAADAIDYAREAGGVVAAPHPFDSRRKGIAELVYSLSLDAIEVINARSSKKANSMAAAAARSLGAARLGSSDAHTPIEIGRAVTVFRRRVDSLDDFVRYILSRDTVAAWGGVLFGARRIRVR
ncbi:MAG: histidinol-phosphatase [Thermoproteota archaeon]|nr:MAG: histidinol-phosphatase [Candidatus Korarchaeota archaeon]